MSFSPLDSTLLSPLTTSAQMRSVFSERRLIGAMLEVEAALARAQAQFNIVPPALAPAIEAISTADFDMAEMGVQTQAAGVPTIPFVRSLQRLLPPELEPHVHRGATTQDILDTALVLQMRMGLDALSVQLGPLLDALISLTERFRRTPCIGRTYGQHAAPITFGFKVAVWLSGIAYAASALKPLRERVLVASLGGPVGTLGGLGDRGPDVADAFAAELGLKPAKIAWHTNRGRIVETGAWLAGLVGALAKMATDIAHLASTEVAEVAEPHGPGRGGSTAMPHKRNPVSCTVILAAHQAAAPLVSALVAAMAAAHERPAGAWHGEWHALPQLFGLAAGALGEARRLAEGLEVDSARMAANLDATGGLLFAERVAGRLSPRLGRETAHRLIEDAADIARRTRRPFADVLAEQPTLAGVDIAGMMDIGPAIAAAQPWIDRVTLEAGAIRRQLP